MSDVAGKYRHDNLGKRYNLRQGTFSHSKAPLRQYLPSPPCACTKLSSADGPHCLLWLFQDGRTGATLPTGKGTGKPPLFYWENGSFFFITSVIIFSIFVLLTLWTTVLCIVVRGFTFQHYDDGGCIYFPFFQCFFF